MQNYEGLDSDWAPFSPRPAPFGPNNGRATAEQSWSARFEVSQCDLEAGSPTSADHATVLGEPGGFCQKNISHIFIIFPP